jgi:PAS domain S-box-containing protein
MAKSNQPASVSQSPHWLLNKKPFEEQLRLKNRALTACAEGVTIADATRPGYPLIYVNRGFEQLTGYSSAQTCGTNCRFLQGKDTDPAAVEEIRRAIREDRKCVVEILNYRKNGDPFWNRLSITPIRNAAGAVTHYVGIQSDVTARRKVEDALRIANTELRRANGIIKKDLEAAAKIQASFLPSRAPELDGVTVAWELIPCDELAGDTLNAFRLNDRYCAFYVLDVSGHGVQAALMSSTLNHLVAPEAVDTGEVSSAPDESEGGVGLFAPVHVVTRLNRQFPFDPEIGQYFTLVYGVLDIRTATFRFVAAGHPAPVYVPAGGQRQILRSNNFPIGIVPEPSYEEVTVQMKPGDRMYLYSDGLVDVTDAREERFDAERLAEKLDKLRPGSLEASLPSLLGQLREWSGKDSFDDDLSVLGFEIS